MKGEGCERFNKNNYKIKANFINLSVPVRIKQNNQSSAVFMIWVITMITGLGEGVLLSSALPESFLLSSALPKSFLLSSELPRAFWSEVHCREISAHYAAWVLSAQKCIAENFLHSICITDSFLLCSEMQTLDFSEENLMVFSDKLSFQITPCHPWWSPLFIFKKS